VAKNKMSTLESLMIPFLIGGSIISGVKYAATHLNNPALAAILGGLPTGLLSIYFLTSEDSIGYANNYFYVTLILATSIMIFYLLRLYTNQSKNISLLIAIGSWILLVLAHYFYVKYDQSS
jgi:uncharacterized membrane protein YGL010W